MLENLIINTSTPEFIEKFNMDMETTSDNRKTKTFYANEYEFLSKRKAHTRNRRKSSIRHITSERNKNKGTVPFYSHDMRVKNHKSSESKITLINNGIFDYFEELAVI